MIDTCHFGDCRESMRQMIAAGVKVQTCVTSPPYWGLRDYGVDGQLGLESTPDEYIGNMVEVFRLVRDLLADDGCLWLNLGDSYYGSWGAQSRDVDDPLALREGSNARRVTNGPHPTLKPKDLVGIPWRVAFALQADGWYLRSDIIWHKPNPMPESVTDRPTKAHEYMFLMSKRERYYYDADAIKEAAITAGAVRIDANEAYRAINGSPKSGSVSPDNRNRRTVWTVATEPYSEAHFATFPTALIEPCILAGTSQKGHCPGCGKGWARVVERTPAAVLSTASEYGHGAGRNDGGRSALVGASSTTLGWQPSCACNLEPVPGIVFDPFLGSGTTAQVAQDLGRRWLGCELNSQYFKLQHTRTAQQGLVLA